MLCNNDISLAQIAIDDWKRVTDSKRLHRQLAAQLYFVRILLGHVNEALSIIREISKSSSLRTAVDECDDLAINSFIAVEKFAFSDDSKRLAKLRNNAAFHYTTLPTKVLREIANNYPDMSFSYSMGNDTLDWHFELADAVMTRMLMFDIYEVRHPERAERRAKLEEISLYEQFIATEFTNFAAHFVHRHSR